MSCCLSFSKTEMVNTTDGSVYYLNGPVLPYTPFYDGFLYTIKDYKLILWWNIRNSSRECIIRTVTFYYYHIGKSFLNYIELFGVGHQQFL